MYQSERCARRILMARTVGYHLVKSGYGLWLPGDVRGHWSTSWDEQIGHFEPHHLHAGDLVRKRMALERMKHPPTRFTPRMIETLADEVGECASKSDWKVVAAAFEPSHMHLLLTYTVRDVDRTAKWLAQQTTKAVHQKTTFAGPVWCEGKWLEFVFDRRHFSSIRSYIERHNLRQGKPANPWPWIVKTDLECSLAGQ
jgi:REP element-mobilizing transposase RayT